MIGPRRSKSTVASTTEKPARDARPAKPQGPCKAEQPRHPTIFEIKASVAKSYHIPVAALESASRAVKYRIPRMVAIHLARRLTDRSFAEIALRLGDRHHSTALHADRRALLLRKQDIAFDAELCAIERRLSER